MGLAEDVRYYGEWMKQEAFKRIGHLYPKVKLPQEQGGSEATVIAWIWARTVKCPNPACGCITPLVRSFVLSKNKNQECYIEPSFENGVFKYTVKAGKIKDVGTVERTGAICLNCKSTIAFDYIRSEGRASRIGQVLMATVAEGKRGRVYCSPDVTQEMAAQIECPATVPETNLPEKALSFRVQVYGMDQHKKLFTNRQLTALTTLSDLVQLAQQKAEANAVAAGMPNDHIGLDNGGNGARAYSEAIAVYLSFIVDKIADYNSTLCHWQTSGGKAANTFSRQSIPMVWDFAEANVFASAYGGWDNKQSWTVDGIRNLPAGRPSTAQQWDVQADCGIRDVLISTDPPYYDNIGYADLSDYFYVWMRQNLKHIYPRLFGTMLVPKAQELIATPYRHEGSVEKAKQFFEEGMVGACRAIYEYTSEDYPITIFYAYKQSDTDEGEGSSSSGWETMLSAIIKAGLSITGTWPMRTELTNRTISLGTNSLASSIILVCRKRSEFASLCTRRNFINELKRELRPALQKLQSSNIAPVDLAQSAIGPGMGVYSKYSQVLEADGTPMTVRSALKIINQEIDLYFNEQDSDLDNESRFCVDLYSQFAFNEIPFGDANTLATAKNTSVAIMASHGTLYAQKGKVHLIERAELPANINTSEQCIWLLCQQLTYRMEKEGVEGCAKVVAEMFGSNVERAKDLAYRLYTIAERKRWAQEGYAYNALVVAWPEIQSRAAELRAAVPQQLSLEDFMTE